MLGMVELVERIDQPDHPGMYQVFDRDIPGQALVNPAREIAHLRQLFQQEAVPILFILPRGAVLCRTHDHVPLFAAVSARRFVATVEKEASTGQVDMAAGIVCAAPKRQ
jgi:hypothetical protein